MEPAISSSCRSARDGRRARRAAPARGVLAALACCAAPAAAAAQALPPDNPKVVVATRVFERVAQAVGDGRAAPGFEVQPGPGGSVAFFDRPNERIVLEERAYDALAGFGRQRESALAVLLGHELAHFYKDHAWSGDFGDAFAGLSVADSVRRVSYSHAELLRIETQADYFGELYGQLAGYATLHVAPLVLDTIYAAYGLQPQLPNYPSLAEREEIARRTAGQLQALLPVFQAGVRLLVAGQAAAAAQAFAHVARTFPSREILNDQAVAWAQAAIGLLPRERVRFAYPLELDAATRLPGLTGMRGLAETERARVLLMRARGALDQAVRDDPDYLPARVNLAAVQELQGEREAALATAGEALARADAAHDAHTAAAAHLVRGIARGNAGSGAAARAEFQAAGSHPLAGLNLAVLGGGRQAAAPPARKEPVRETIAGQGIRTLRGGDAVAIQIPTPGAGGGAMLLYVKDLGGADASTVDQGDRGLTVLATPAGYAGASGRGVHVGDPVAAVDRLYGQPTRIVIAPGGSYRVYETAQLVFETDARQHVQGWWLYRTWQP